MTDKVKTTAGPVRLTGRLICRSACDIEAVRTHLPQHIRLTRAEAGCISFSVVQSEDPLIWHVEERFVDMEALAFHQQRTRASSWWTATAGIPRDYEGVGVD
ncbi:putative quinol monooxygenase [Halodurantibacterium flavum]|uniref:Quinol monooxygenase n=1 Tax=Halodurantibacterium flavum TaxID=1382802 RepID=A0ABW4S1H9_9RHOB